ncbi:MAG: hypothetical protein NZ602_17470 [Thermoguttaceae bacterium]|nr:hypothetical protein [Thermoguttaceae bacterium]MDW8038393.1 hypothetical protein [Thermoguttaceae bacterium]
MAIALSQIDWVPQIPIPVGVTVVFAIVLALELLVYSAYSVWLRRQRQMLEALVRLGHPPDRASEKWAKNTWVDWVLVRLEGKDFLHGRYTRTDALAAWDHWLESHSGYLLLQRLAVIAPVLGVLLTVLGIASFPTPGTNGAVEGLENFKGLVWGVGVGATLALVAQGLLYLVSRKLESARQAGYRWFDECIWHHLQIGPQESALDLADSFQKMGATIRGSIQQYHTATEKLNQASQFLHDATTSSLNIYEQLERFQQQLEEAQRQWADRQKRLLDQTEQWGTRLAGRMEDLLENIQQSSLQWAQTAQEIRSVPTVFQQAAAQHQQAAEALGTSINQIRTGAAHLTQSIQQLTQIANQQTAVGNQWLQSLQNEVLPVHKTILTLGGQLRDSSAQLTASQQAFTAAVEQMARVGQGLDKFIHEGLDPATRRLADLNKIIAGIHQIAELLQQIPQIRQEFSAFRQALEQTTQSLQNLNLRFFSHSYDQNPPFPHPQPPGANRSLFRKLLGWLWPKDEKGFPTTPESFGTHLGSNKTLPYGPTGTRPWPPKEN